MVKETILSEREMSILYVFNQYNTKSLLHKTKVEKWQLNWWLMKCCGYRFFELHHQFLRNAFSLCFWWVWKWIEPVLLKCFCNILILLIVMYIFNAFVIVYAIWFFLRLLLLKISESIQKLTKKNRKKFCKLVKFSEYPHAKMYMLCTLCYARTFWFLVILHNEKRNEMHV